MLTAKNRFQNVAYTSNGLERTLAPSKYRLQMLRKTDSVCQEIAARGAA